MNAGEHDAAAERPPDLLTQSEVIELLRLDQLGLRDPKESLRYRKPLDVLVYICCNVGSCGLEPHGGR